MYDCYANELYTISYAKRFVFESQTFFQTFQNFVYTLFIQIGRAKVLLLNKSRAKVLLLNMIFLMNAIKAINQILLIEPDVNYSSNALYSLFLNVCFNEQVVPCLEMIVNFQ